MAFSSARAGASPLRQRPLGRAATFADAPAAPAPAAATAGAASPLETARLRRASFATADSAAATPSVLSSAADDLLLPRPGSGGGGAGPGTSAHTAPSAWHSAPLALALLPALGGLLFQDGSAVVTDLTLLGLAAIFLNWSVRLPWAWYHAAQTIRVLEEEPPADDGYFPPADTIDEEPNEDDDPADPSASSDKPRPTNPSPSRSHPTSPTRRPRSRAASPSTTRGSRPRPPSAAQAAAARELRLHEVLALLACAAGPAAGAWLLHALRAALSRPSEGLVSDYNLAVFLLAAEVRPLRHLLALGQARTLHLQRVVAAHPYRASATAAAHGGGQAGVGAGAGAEELAALRARLDALEARLPPALLHGTSTGGTGAAADPGAQPGFVAAARRALAPELDALTRAVRRYEKRAAVLGAQTDGRLRALDGRVGDALALAAAAERRGAGRGVLGATLDVVGAAVAVPVRAAWGAAVAVVGLPGVLGLRAWRAVGGWRRGGGERRVNGVNGAVVGRGDAGKRRKKVVVAGKE